MEIVFSFDTTLSMYHCLEAVRGLISDIVQRLQADIPGIKIGIFAHGDYCDKRKYVTKYIDFTDDFTKLVDFVQNVQRTGGGDSDECYELVLHEVRTKLSWTPGTQRALVLFGDAKPHEPKCRSNKLKLNWRTEADLLKGIGVRIYSLKFGSYHESEHFYSEIARKTDGRFLKFTDLKNASDFLMAVCYKEKGDDLLHAYEKEVRGRNEAIHKELDTMFSDLRHKPSTSSSGPEPDVVATSVKVHYKPSKAGKRSISKLSTTVTSLPLIKGFKKVSPKVKRLSNRKINKK